MKVVSTFGDARRCRHGRVGFVPTMGALHAGHRSLFEAARPVCDTVMVSIFVNPLQFDDPGDLERYPRTLDADLALCEAAGVEVVFAPPPEEMYPRQMLTAVRVNEVADRMEGPNRPGHFDGVATVVAKLFAGLGPDAAFFGRKDAQQVAVITTMTADLGFPIEIVACPTLRTAAGLAISSRNVFLSPSERIEALALSRGLMTAADAVEAGARDAATIESIARAEFAGLETEYVELASQDRAERMTTLDRPAFLAVAAWVGATRLIDNVAFDVTAAGLLADRGRRLDSEA